MTGIALALAFLAAAALGWPATAAVACAGVALLAARDRRRGLLAPAIVVVLASIGGALRGAPPPEPVPPSWVDVAEAVRGRVASVPTVTGRFRRYVVRTESVRTGDEWAPATGAVCVTAPAYPEADLGDEVRLGGTTRSVRDEAASTRAFFGLRGCGASLFARWSRLETTGSGWRRWPAVAGRSLGNVIRRAAPGDAGSLLVGLVTGDDAALSSERQEAFMLTGTTHLTAVSGANVALLLTIGVAAGNVAGWRRRLSWQLLTIGLVWVYALITGLGAPVSRAALVATGALLASRVGRRADVVTLVLLAGAVSVAVVPTILWSLSFQLSLAASLALAAVVSSLNPVGVRGWLQAALLATVAAQVATLPILLPISGTASLIATPANVLVGPLVELAFPLAAVGALLGMVWAPAGQIAIFPATLCADAILVVVDTLAKAPLAEQLGTISPGGSVVVWAAVALAVGGLSRDGRSWASRLPREARALSAPARAGWAGAVAGIILLALFAA